MTHLLPSLKKLSSLPLQLVWIRRDLRLEDHPALYQSLKDKRFPTLVLFIFDKFILDQLDNKEDRRVTFLYKKLLGLHEKLKALGSSLLLTYGEPLAVFHQLTQQLSVKVVHTNEDYEPYARERDQAIESFLKEKGIQFNGYRDHVIFHPEEIQTTLNKPYTIYTPYKRRWRELFSKKRLDGYPAENCFQQLLQLKPLPLFTLKELGFVPSLASFPPLHFSEPILKAYGVKRDLLVGQNSSLLGVHLRFGTVSIRQLTRMALQWSDSWLDQLIWRNFYIMILYKFPHVVDRPFKKKYEKIAWENSEKKFLAWYQGRTGFPLVDAGMRELNQTGLMHNRSRMLAANFLTKILLIDWQWGATYFAKQLLDYDLALNNGNWQWSAGTGCDAAPYFRIFNPLLQLKKFDPALLYTKKWVPEYGTSAYPAPIVNYELARKRALQFFKKNLS